MQNRYFDWAATAPPLAAVRETVDRCAADYYANPSSRHHQGREASAVLEESRCQVASALGCDAQNITFTSGGTESNSLVLASLFWKKRKGSVVLSSAEHASVYGFIPFFREIGCEVITLPAPLGFVSPDELSRALRKETSLVCLNAVHNVSGAVQDLPALVSAVRDYEQQSSAPRIHVHLDAVQALGKVPFSLKTLDIDSASFSAHKCSGPRGIGALYSRNPASPISSGGGQESGMRGGTENLPGIAGFAAALDYMTDHCHDHARHFEEVRSVLIDALSCIPGIVMLQNRESSFAPSILLISVSPIPSEVMIRLLSDRGFSVSAGSACSSKSSKKLERVLEAMGISSEAAAGVLRISFGHSTSIQDAALLAEALREEVQKLKGMLA